MKQQSLHSILFFLLISWTCFAQSDSVNMIAFVGVSTDKGVELTWTTEGEHNVEAFLLERSLNASDFEKVNNVLPHSEAGVRKKEYIYKDNNIFRKHVYYRITALMPSGNEQSKIIAVVRDNMDLPNIMIYPTIVSQNVNIVKNSTENMSNARIRVLNISSGMVVVDKSVNSDFLVESIDVSDYYAGAYVVELYNSEFASKAKFVKQY